LVLNVTASNAAVSPLGELNAIYRKSLPFFDYSAPSTKLTSSWSNSEAFGLLETNEILNTSTRHEARNLLGFSRNHWG
jgi:hypothetical protein